MFLIDAIKHNVGCLGEVSRNRTNKTSFVSFCTMFFGGKKTLFKTNKINNYNLGYSI